MAVKRRVVWFSDQDWTALEHVAEVRGDSISRVLRDMLRLSRPTDPDEWLPAEAGRPPLGLPGSINPAAFNRRPFTPVPKKGK